MSADAEHRGSQCFQASWSGEAPAMTRFSSKGGDLCPPKNLEMTRHLKEKR